MTQREQDLVDAAFSIQESVRERVEIPTIYRARLERALAPYTDPQDLGPVAHANGEADPADFPPEAYDPHDFEEIGRRGL